MIFCIQTIFDKNLLEGAKLVAGAPGTRNPVQWVNCMEILDTPESLQQGELLVTTGYRLDNKDEYSDFLDRAYKRGISGIAIQPGYYISKIPAYIIAEGNRLGLPVIELPANLTFSGILHTLIRNIASPKEDEPDRDYRKLMLLVESDQQVPEHGIAVVICPAAGHTSGELQESFLNQISSTINSLCTNIKLYRKKSITAFSASLRDTVTVDLLQAELSTEISKYSSNLHKQIFCGISHITEPECISAAFARGYAIVKTLASERACKGACCDEGIPFLRLCSHLSEQKKTPSTANRILDPLLRYDDEHKKTLMRTLRLYLASRGQISVCSKILCIHRKTMKKRLEHIAQLCGLSPESYSGGMGFALALAAYDYFLL